MTSSISRRKRRKLKSEINVVPYIDVMLVLLIIFIIRTLMSHRSRWSCPSQPHPEAGRGREAFRCADHAGGSRKDGSLYWNDEPIL
ncbi:hypothetical protein HH297_00690, partial [Xanthomonas sp. Kuri4-3]